MRLSIDNSFGIDAYTKHNRKKHFVLAHCFIDKCVLTAVLNPAITYSI